MTVEWPDVEGGIRDYLRGHTDVAAAVGARVFFGVPDEPTFPLVAVRRVGGGDDTSEAPIDQALIQLDCWGGVDAAGHGKKAEADTVRRAVRQALYEIRGATALNASTVAYGAAVTSDVFLPDPNNDRPRYAVTALVTARKT